MTDFFARLQVERRPWLDAEALKRKFLELSAASHPDKHRSADEPARRAVQSESAEFNAAYRCLSDPRLRLRHLLDLQRGPKPDELQRVPSELMEASLEVSRLCRDSDAFL